MNRYTVAQLIEALKEFPQDKMVWVGSKSKIDESWSFQPLDKVNFDVADNTVDLEGSGYIARN